MASNPTSNPTYEQKRRAWLTDLRALEARAVTRQALADLLGITTQTIRNWLADDARIPPQPAVRLVRRLNVEAAALDAFLIPWLGSLVEPDNAATVVLDELEVDPANPHEAATTKLVKRETIEIAWETVQGDGESMADRFLGWAWMPVGEMIVFYAPATDTDPARQRVIHAYDNAPDIDVESHGNRPLPLGASRFLNTGARETD
jgi:transcriptional regulator with XRE-family HTH domain